MNQLHFDKKKNIFFRIACTKTTGTFIKQVNKVGFDVMLSLKSVLQH